MSARIVHLHARQARLKRLVRQHLKKLGFLRDTSGKLVPPSLDKDGYRQMHAWQRADKLEKNKAWLDANAPKLFKHFAAGSEIQPEEIKPELRLVQAGTWEADLFRLAAFNWRVPVSDGYGRRMRFLVWDKAHRKLIGLIALGDAVFNQRARDNYIGWDHSQRSDALVHLMDAYVLGAVPPYSNLLGGKLVASLIRSREVVRAFDRKYRSSVGLISGINKQARLAAITTSSALGRSSIYNRLVLGDTKILQPIGFTSGWGHFHFSGSLFDELRDYLASLDDPYANGFTYGAGPNWKIRVIKKALDELGLDPGLAQHGLQREVFICPIASNSNAFLRGEEKRPKYDGLRTVADLSDLAKARWVLPRSIRDKSYLDVRPEDFTRQFVSPGGRRRGDLNALGP